MRRALPQLRCATQHSEICHAPMPQFCPCQHSWVRLKDDARLVIKVPTALPSHTESTPAYDTSIASAANDLAATREVSPTLPASIECLPLVNPRLMPETTGAHSRTQSPARIRGPARGSVGSVGGCLEHRNKIKPAKAAEHRSAHERSTLENAQRLSLGRMRCPRSERNEPTQVPCKAVIKDKNPLHINNKQNHKSRRNLQATNM